MKTIFLISLILFILACTGKTNMDNNDFQDKVKTRNSTETEESENNNENNNINHSSFDFEKFQIAKLRIGKVKIGMSLKEVDLILNELTKVEVPAWNYGFDGGSEAFEYSLNGNPVLGVIPYMGTDSIIALISLHENIKTKSGAHVGMTAGELFKLYPNELINENLLTSTEYLYDAQNQWTFIFDTKPNNRIAHYPEIEVGVRPKNLKPKMDWIIIQ